uniref:Uncharacterized protein n=1 Tax=uncultured marine virus TaxID=186617 RepID=A0A0F7L907_9VIRU|nr:hypothetical protein [uncultured marine virus]
MFWGSMWTETYLIPSGALTPSKSPSGAMTWIYGCRFAGSFTKSVRTLGATFSSPYFWIACRAV